MQKMRLLSIYQVQFYHRLVARQLFLYILIGPAECRLIIQHIVVVVCGLSLVVVASL